MDRLEPYERADDASGGRARVAGLTPLPGAHQPVDPWNYRPDAGWTPEFNLMGYRVQATDGKLGKVSEVNQVTNESYLVVATGLLGGKVLIPVGTVTFIDHGEHRVYLDCTKDEVKGAPDFDPQLYREAAYRERTAGYWDLKRGNRPLI